MCQLKNQRNQQNQKNNKGENLIFIVGLPRSGTTLLHQIISSHSRTFGAEESHVMSDFFIKKFKLVNSFVPIFIIIK